MSALDVSIFEKEKIGNCYDGDYTCCAAIHRIIVALKYYAALNVKKDENDREIFGSFVNEIYTNIVNDNNHFMTVHGDQIKEIYDSQFMKKCSLKKCQFTQRHFEPENNLNIGDDQNMNFYVNLLDSLHFVICHCYDAGFRVEQNEQKSEDQIDDKTLFDAEFARINTIIRKTDFETKLFERISSRAQSNTKFVLSKAEQGDTTFLDQLYKNLISESMDIGTLKALIEAEDYDSDSIKMDVANYANIKMCKHSIKQFIYGISLQSNTFSVGLRFYYWQHYKKIVELPTNEQMINGWDNKHDHGGYKVLDLFVRAKHGSFNDEIANYSNFDIAQYKMAKSKTKKFIKSEKIKKLTAKYTYGYSNQHMFLHYGISLGSLLLFGHILSLVLYTDYSKLSSAFSSTFRQVRSFETLKSIKRRNASFFWMSKFLRELVECFGQCSEGDYTLISGTYCDQMSGPYFCGVNIKLHVDSFAMRLNSPSSTSKQLSVAIKFSGPLGAVFTFDNPSDSPQYRNLRGFDCSYISRFKEEDERLFFGGFSRIKVVSVRLVKTKENMKEFAAALFEFDKCLSGGIFSKETKNGFLIINSLINLCLEKKTNDVKLPSFIIDCFRAFVQNKKEIVVNKSALYISGGDANVNKLLFSHEDGVLRSEILALFRNAQMITYISHGRIETNKKLR